MDEEAQNQESIIQLDTSSEDRKENSDSSNGAGSVTVFYVTQTDQVRQQSEQRLLHARNTIEIHQPRDYFDYGSTSIVTTECTERDVLMGRGKRVSEWPGNVSFRQIVSQYRQAYASAERTSKMKVALDVIQEVCNRNGRFLRESNGRSACDGADPTAVWVVVAHARAVEKACQALRERVGKFDFIESHVSSSEDFDNNKQQLIKCKIPLVEEYSDSHVSSPDRRVRIRTTTKTIEEMNRKRSYKELMSPERDRQSSGSDDSYEDVGEPNSSFNYISNFFDQNSPKGSLDEGREECHSFQQCHREKHRVNSIGESRYDPDFDRKQDASNSITSIVNACYSMNSNKVTNITKGEVDAETILIDRNDSEVCDGQFQSLNLYQSSSDVQSPDQTKLVKEYSAKNRLHAIPSTNSTAIFHMPDGKEMFKRVLEYKAVHGHTAVPPGWIRDKILADWCTVQRQLHREITSGYRDFHNELTPQEKEMYLSLQEMDFCFIDYEEWHWDHQYNTLLQYEHWIQKEQTLQDETGIQMKSKRKSLYLWLQDQQRQHREGLPLSTCRLERLEELGIVLH